MNVLKDFKFVIQNTNLMDIPFWKKDCKIGLIIKTMMCKRCTKPRNRCFNV